MGAGGGFVHYEDYPFDLGTPPAGTSILWGLAWDTATRRASRPG